MVFSEAKQTALSVAHKALVMNWYVTDQYRAVSADAAGSAVVA